MRKPDRWRTWWQRFMDRVTGLPVKPATARMNWVTGLPGKPSSSRRAAPTFDPRARALGLLLRFGAERGGLPMLAVDRSVRCYANLFDIESGQGFRLLDDAGRSRLGVLLELGDRDGRIREAALQGLQIQDCDAPLIAMLLIRCRDWVPRVAEVARAILARVAEANPADLALNVELVVKLSSLDPRGKSAMAPVWTVLREPEGLRELALLLPGAKTSLRRAIYEVAAGARELARDFARRALADPDAGIAAQGLRELATSLPAHEGREVLDEACLSHRGSLRLAAHRLLLESDGSLELERLRRALRDRVRALRDLALWHCRQRGIDPAALLRADLSRLDGSAFRSALEGLAACGSVEDIELFRSHLDDPIPGRRRIALQGLARIDRGRALDLDLLLGALADPSPSVSRVAALLLRERSLGTEQAGIAHLLEHHECAHVRFQALRLLRSARKYSALRFILLALLDPDERLRRSAGFYLGHWLRDANRKWDHLEGQDRVLLRRQLDLAREGDRIAAPVLREVEAWIEAGR